MHVAEHRLTLTLYNPNPQLFQVEAGAMAAVHRSHLHRLLGSPLLLFALAFLPHPAFADSPPLKLVSFLHNWMYPLMRFIFRLQRSHNADSEEKWHSAKWATQLRYYWITQNLSTHSWGWSCTIKTPKLAACISSANNDLYSLALISSWVGTWMPPIRCRYIDPKFGLMSKLCCKSNNTHHTDDLAAACIADGILEYFSYHSPPS